MNNQPTPETDALHEHRREVHAAYFMMVSHARRLERERDEAREAYIIAVDQVVVAQSDHRKERALADRLAKGIELFLSQTVSPLAPLKVPLDAWKEARNV